MAAGDRLPNGSYRIFNGVLPKDASLKYLCLNVPMSRDEPGQTLNLGPAGIYAGQYFHAFSQGASAGREQMIFAPGIGLAVDIKDQAMADGTPVRMWNSWAWSGTGTAPLAQTWDIIETDKTMQITVQGKPGTYPLYKVLAHKDNAFCLESGGEGGEARLPVQLWRFGGALDQLWAFVPAPDVPEGIYTVRSALDPTLVLSVNGASTADGAMCTTYKYRPDANELMYRVATDDKGVTRFTSCLKEKFNINSQRKGGDADGALVQHYTTNDDDRYSQWLLVDDGYAVDTNGSTVPGWQVVAAISQEANRCLDVADGSTQLSTQVRLWTPNGSAAQRFHLEPDEAYDPGLPVPSGVCTRYYDPATKASTRTNLLALAPGTSFPAQAAWMCDHDLFQVRTRVRSRPYGGRMGEWGPWADDDLGLTGNRGWGPVWGSESAASDGSSHWGLVNVYRGGTIGRGDSDRVDIQYEVRSYSESAGVLGLQAHGPSATGTTVVCWRPTVEVTAVAFGGTGLVVGYRSDLPRGGNSVTVTVEGYGSARADQADSQGYVAIPVEDLTGIPREGEAVRASVELWTADGARGSVAYTAAVAYDAGTGPALQISVAVYGPPDRREPLLVSDAAGRAVSDVGSGWTAAELAQLLWTPGEDKSYLAVAGGLREGTRAFVQVPHGHGDRMLEVDPLRIPYPLNREWTLWAVWRNPDDAGEWSMWHRSFPAVACRASLWDCDRGRFAMLVGAGGPPKMRQTLTADVEKHVTTGRERAAYTFGRTVESDLSCSGAVAPSMGYPSATRDAADMLAHARRAHYRRPDGLLAAVVIEQVELDDTNRGYTEVSITQHEETR